MSLSVLNIVERQTRVCVKERERNLKTMLHRYEQRCTDRGRRESEGGSDLAGGKTLHKRLSVGSLSSTRQHPKATYKHRHIHTVIDMHM